jgi:hypothetical protein
MMTKGKKPKMMQVNVLDQGQGKLSINIKRQGFSDPEVIGILEMAKGQVQRMMRTNLEHNARFKGPFKGPFKGDDKK